MKRYSEWWCSNSVSSASKSKTSLSGFSLGALVSLGASHSSNLFATGPVTNGRHRVAMSNAEYLMSNANLFSHASITMLRKIYLALILFAIVKKCQHPASEQVLLAVKITCSQINSGRMASLECYTRVANKQAARVVNSLQQHLSCRMSKKTTRSAVPHEDTTVRNTY